MAEAWKKWEGQVVNGEFPLRQYLGGSDHSAVFLSQRGEREPQQVAIKLVPASAENPELQLSWWELAAKLSHPNLLRLFQRGRCQLDDTELFYAVMEYAEESLAQIIPHRPLTPAEARDTFQPLLDALAYVHARGFVHGHIKPSNIMAVGDQIKLSSDELCGAGESGRVLGMTSVYSAPEIEAGQGMSPASDVWSLGMTLVEALTQRVPLSEGTDAELILPETIPEPFFDIANHCLRQDPQRRWTITEILARLQRAPTVSVEEKIRETRSSFPRWGYVAGVAALGVLLWGILKPASPNRPSNPEPAPPIAADSSKPESEAAAEAPTSQSAKAPVAAKQPPAESSSGVPQVVAGNSGAQNPDAQNPGAKNLTTGSVRGEVAHQVSPDVSKSARNTIHGKVKVKVRVMVDSSGSVVVAKFDSRGPSKYFSERALEAGRQWVFKPPQVDGQGVPSEWILKFEFARNGTTIHSEQTSP